MARSEIDVNGFKVIEAMPISKVGVFPYLGKQIDYDGEMGLEPNRIYNVFRSPEALFDADAIKSFNGKPFIDNHEMLGQGFTPVDKRPADGTIYNVRQSMDMPEYLIADTNIFTDKMIKKIADGKRELSLGYRCQYVPQAGVYNGTPYEFIQTNLRGNHLALVEHGRCGSSVCVCDGALITMDSLPKEIQDMENDEKKEARLRSKLNACLKGDDEQGCQDALDFLDLSPEDRKAALAAVKGGKPEPKTAPAEDGKAKDMDPVPAPPAEGSDVPKDDKDDAKTPDGGEVAEQKPEETEETVAVETTEEVPVGDQKGKCCGKSCAKDEGVCTADGGKCVDSKGVGTCDKCGKPMPVAEKTEEVVVAEKPVTADKKACDCGAAPATATIPSAPVPKSKVQDCDQPDQKSEEDGKEGDDDGDDEKIVFTKDELDALTAKIRADYSRAQKLANAIRKSANLTFDSGDMSEAEVARYAVQKIPCLAFAADAADDVVLGVVRGHLADRENHVAPKTVKVPTADEAIPARHEAFGSVERDLTQFYK